MKNICYKSLKMRDNNAWFTQLHSSPMKSQYLSFWAHVLILTTDPKNKGTVFVQLNAIYTKILTQRKT
jgi:hypothetical protein